MGIQKKEKHFKIKINLIIVAVSLLIIFVLFLFIFKDRENFTHMEKKLTEILSEYDVVFGNRNASIILIEYSSFDCLACRFYHRNYFDKIEEAIENGKIAYIIRLIPWQSELSKNLVKAAYCSYRLTKSINYIKSIYLNFENIRGLEDTFQYFNGNLDEFKSCINSVEAEINMRNNIKNAINDKIEGTPTFILIKNGEIQRLVGAQKINLN